MKKTKQFQAGIFIISNSQAGLTVLNKVSLCALQPDCMAPKDAQVFCPFPDYTKNDKVVCHRFDQSALNLRLIELYGTNASHYYKPSNLIRIVRIEKCLF